MTEKQSLEAVNRRIAADVLVTLINQGRFKPGGASSSNSQVIKDTLKAYQDLLTGIHSAKVE